MRPLRYVSEEQLTQAAHTLGEAAAQCDPSEKEIIRQLYARVQQFAEEQRTRGVSIDRSAFFAAGLILHPDLKDQVVLEAARSYIELDRLFVITHSA